MRKFRLIEIFALGALLAGIAAPAQEKQMVHGSDLACAVCHVEAQPTASSAALLACPRGNGADPGSNTAPDIFLLDELSDLYVPVVFPHKLHAAMTEMGQGCDVCHHQHETEEIPPCKSCHGGASNPVNLRQPGLKGAYHRQCLGCHREWTHETDCVVCHAKREPGMAEIELPKDPTDIMGILHPNIAVPDTKVYKVPAFDMGPVVTFHHKEHVELFGLECVACHKEESCNRCHENGNHEPHVRQDPHEDCVKCHEAQIADMECATCHKTEAAPGFQHAERTGFDLAKFHAERQCADCHKDGMSFKGLSTACSSCHEPGWFPENFDHARTGSPLDEKHALLDCGMCHGNGLGGELTCAACHEEMAEKPAE